MTTRLVFCLRFDKLHDEDEVIESQLHDNYIHKNIAEHGGKHGGNTGGNTGRLHGERGGT